MRVLHSRRLRVLECFFRMLDAGIRMSFFAVRRGAPGMLNRLIDMFIAGECNTIEHGHADKRPNRSQHHRASTNRDGHREPPPRLNCNTPTERIVRACTLHSVPKPVKKTSQRGRLPGRTREFFEAYVCLSRPDRQSPGSTPTRTPDN